MLHVTVTGGVEGGEDVYYTAAPLQILIRPKDVPRKIVPGNSRESIELPQTPDHKLTLSPRGVYADGTERDLSSPEVGTTYISSKPFVASVDANGNVTGHKPGVAVLTAEHRGVRGFTIVEINDRGHPLLPEDVTAELRVERGVIRDHPKPNSKLLFVQALRITNTGSIPVVGPLYVVLGKLPPDVKQWGMGGTEQIQPKDSPYADVPLPTTGLSLVPGESVTVQLEFLSPDAKSIQYELRVFRADQP